jgi:hypothetical protein
MSELFESKLEKKSPQQYSPKGKIIELESTNKPIDFNKYEEYNPIDMIFFRIPDSDYEFNDELNFNINSYEYNPEIVYNKEFKSFLCELETFNWIQKEDIDHKSNVINLGYKIRYDTYTSHLINMFGSDITLYGSVYSDHFENNPTPSNGMVNRLVFTKNLNSDVSKYIAEKRLEKGYNSENLVHSLFFEEVEKNVFGGLFTIQILQANTRYAIINIPFVYLESTHYTFLFVDYDSKLLEYYDPYGNETNEYSAIFIRNALKKLFIGYEINEFWNMKGIQVTERIQDDKYAFCVIWGHMILHLKLLNIHRSVEDIENMFIEECKTKNMALYEVMLNYAYFMSRFVPESADKFVKLDLITKLKS